MAGGTLAFPAHATLGTRASRSHGGRDALLGSAASRHARKKPTPLSRKVPPASKGNREEVYMLCEIGYNLSGETYG